MQSHVFVFYQVFMEMNQRRQGFLYPIAAKLWSKSLNQCRGSYRFEWDENGKKQQKAIWTIDKMSNF